MDWEKIFTSYASNKRFVFGICKEFLQLSKKKTNNPLKNEQRI